MKFPFGMAILVSGRARDSKKCCPSFSVKDKKKAEFFGSEELSSSKESEKRVVSESALFQPMRRPSTMLHFASLGASRNLIDEVI